jgi:hypothetical protein
MDGINRVFFPLRSNIGWFQSDEPQEQIEKDVKQSILLFDEIYIEDGTLMSEVKPDGSFVMYAPPGGLPNDQRNIEYHRDLESTDVPLKIDDFEILTGKSIARFKIDYFRIFESIETSEFDFLKFVFIDGKTPDELEKMIQKETDEDRRLIGDLNMPIALRDFLSPI